ncbi:MAG: serine/threonine protein kinase [Planctomycetaceae bacterium]|nr:serine/threonine protein kinase [Planctomycetaceae bacterium]
MITASTPVAEVPSEPDLSGRRLGDYQFLRRLGRGGMAEVYLAEQLSLRRQVAIKVLRQSLASDESYVRRFHHEAQAAAKLVHANIVTIHEVGCVEGWHYIAQEYVPGQNLKQLLSRLGRGLDPPQAVTILRGVAAALGKAAEQNITHRDIKPENIMLASSGEVKVADFGLARVAQAGEALNLTQVGITMGTPLYMSPEQVEGKEVDPRSDLYSLGVTTYHMLAGRPPFDGETALAVAVQHLKTEPGRLELLRPDLPEGLCRVVHKLLAKQPKDRYQKAAELLKDLKGLTIPGLDTDWSTDLPGWAGDATAALEGRLAATQELSRIMQIDAGAGRTGWPAWKSALVVTLLTLLGVCGGAVAAWLTRPAPLLQAAASDSIIPRLNRADEQFYYANMARRDHEEAWLAVARYFPPDESPLNKRYARLAAKGLANYYLSNNRLSEARILYEQLAHIEASEEPVLRLTGIAGCAVVYDRLIDESEDKGPVIFYLAQLEAVSDDELRRIGDTLYEALGELFEKYRAAD